MDRDGLKQVLRELLEEETMYGYAALGRSGSGSAGATAAIGPGLAARLAGHNVRVTVLARTVRENGALHMRIAYDTRLSEATGNRENFGYTRASLPRSC